MLDDKDYYDRALSSAGPDHKIRKGDVKIIDNLKRPISQDSSENLHFDSMVSFDYRPRIQPNYQISNANGDYDTLNQESGSKDMQEG